MEQVKKFYIISIFVVTNKLLISAEYCQNLLLTKRNISISVSTTYGFGNPKNIYDPQQSILYSTQLTDSEGHVKIASWTAGLNNKEQYWQVLLEAPSIVRGIVTQGRNGCCQQWVTAYKIFYSSDCQTFHPVAHEDGPIFEANHDENSPVTHLFGCPIKAKCIRIVPEAWHNHIAMRFEILGCPIKQYAVFVSTTYAPTSTFVNLNEAITQSQTAGSTNAPPGVHFSNHEDSNMTKVPASSLESTTRSDSTTSASEGLLSSISNSVSRTSGGPSSFNTSSANLSSTVNLTNSVTDITNSQPTTFQPSSDSSSFYTSPSPILSSAVNPTSSGTGSVKSQTTTPLSSNGVTSGLFVLGNSSTGSSSVSQTVSTSNGITITTVFSGTTLSCRDKNGVDCHMMAGYFNICKDSISAKQYCPKYCGLCSMTQPNTVVTDSVTASTSETQSGFNLTSTEEVTTVILSHTDTPTSTFISSTSNPSMSTTSTTSSSSTTPLSLIYSQETGSSGGHISSHTETPSGPLMSSTMTTYDLLTVSFETTPDQTTQTISSRENLTTTTVADKSVCNKQNLIQLVTCNFDSGACGYNLTQHPHLWDIVNYEDGGNGTAVSILGDHTNGSTNGSYAFFDARDINITLGSAATMTSQSVPPKAVFCLSFWYNMPTNDANLVVYKKFTNTTVADEQLWARSNGKTNGWREASVILWSSNFFQVVFSSNKTSAEGYFGVDDIAFYFVAAQ